MVLILADIVGLPIHVLMVTDTWASESAGIDLASINPTFSHDCLPEMNIIFAYSGEPFGLDQRARQLGGSALHTKRIMTQLPFVEVTMQCMRSNIPMTLVI